MMRFIGKSIIYLTLAFGVSWSALTVGWLEGARVLADAPWANWGFVCGPPLAAVTCALAFPTGRRRRELGLAAGMNRWWLASALLPFVMAGFTLLMAQAFPGVGLPALADIRAAVSTTFHIPARRLPDSDAGMVAIMAGIAFGFSLLFTLTEEIGWRGYLYSRTRRLGFWRCSLLTGLVWGVWHWPMVFLFGLIFETHRLLGLLYYPLALMALAPLMTLLRDRSGSIWGPGIYHGTSNMITIVAFGAMQGTSAPSFAEIALSLPTLVFIELFRRRFPDPAISDVSHSDQGQK